MKIWNSLIIATIHLSLGACAFISQSEDKPPLLSYCDLVAEPSQYDGQVVRVRATHNVGWEWSYLTDESCSSDSADTPQTWIIISSDTWCEGARPTNTYVPNDYDGSRSVSLERKVTVVGTFHGTTGGPVGYFSIDFICLEGAEKWQTVR